MPLYHAACQWQPLPEGGKRNRVPHAHCTPLFLSAVPCSMPFSPIIAVMTCSVRGPPSGISCWHAACKWSAKSQAAGKWNAKWHAIVHDTRKWHATVQRWQPGVVQQANRMPRANFTERVWKSGSLLPRGRAVLPSGLSARAAVRHSACRPRCPSP